MKKNIGYLAVLVMLAASSYFSLRLFTTERASHDIVKVGSFPMIVGEWKGRDLPMTEREYDILETRNVLSREFARPSGEKLHLLIIYSETNRSVFHPPEVCLMGDGMNMTEKRVGEISGYGDKFTTNELFLEKKGEKEITLYSYKAGRIYTDNFYLQQTYLMLHQIFGRNVPGATVRVSMPMGENKEATLAIMRSFLTDSIRILDQLSSKASPAD